jgi:ubiquinone/menaquinone biosynthesis C-methylase UbiE
MSHVCPWWGGYFIDNRLRRLLHQPERILAPYVKPGMTALDFGCGMGFFAIPMARLVGSEGRVIAADLQPQMLAVLGKRAAQAGVADRIEALRCEPDMIGVGEPVDFVLCFWSVHEVPDQSRLLAELNACLRREGRLLVAEPIGHVSRDAFNRTLSLAEELGLKVHERPRIRFSRAVVLARSEDG